MFQINAPSMKALTALDFPSLQLIHLAVAIYEITHSGDRERHKPTFGRVDEAVFYQAIPQHRQGRWVPFSHPSGNFADF